MPPAAPVASLLMMDDDDDEDVVFTNGDLTSAHWAQFEAVRREGHLCDVRIRVGDLVLSAHRVVLTVTIPYFRAMFTSHMREANAAEVQIGGIDSTTADTMIEPETVEALVSVPSANLGVVVRSTTRTRAGCASTCATCSR